MAVSRRFGLVVNACLCYLFTHFVIVYGINLDARFSALRRGGPGTYFGFSVAQHQILDSSDKVEQNVFLIGAPKEVRPINGNNTGGALYQCNAKETSPSSCVQITAGISTPPLLSEVVDDQWLGVTIASQGPGKKTVACAHRYIKDNAALGKCYVFEQSLDEVADPALGLCSPMQHLRYMLDFGLCQAGMSASIGQDDALVIGAPGSVIWQGVIFATNVTDVLGASKSEKHSPYVEAKQSTETEQATPTKGYSYNGYSIAMGRFDRTKVLYYVSGAPKSNNVGEVVFFKQLPSDTLRYEIIIKGPSNRAFSGFGSSLLAVDLNNDGYDDLIVGAPYYFGTANRVGGAFYVYLGGESLMALQTQTPTEVLGQTLGDELCDKLGCEHARFGISLSKLGDVNMDSYQDFAVGAPYEGSGAVYIYHGSNSEAGFNVNFAQRIEASELPVSGLVSFGYSLSGGMDLDENGYPDLLVGAYESDAVVLIRSRPIIKIIPQSSVFPKAVNLEATPNCNASVKPEFKNRHCLTVEMCLSFTTKPANSIKVVPRVVYRLEAEPKRRVPRVELLDGDVLTNVLKNKTLSLTSGKLQCITEIAFLKSQFEDKLNSMEFRFSFGLETDFIKPQNFPQSSVQDVNLFPVLDTKGAEEKTSNAVPVYADFVMECGDDNKCHSNLQFTSELQGLTKGHNDTYEMVISQHNHLHVALRVNNEGEPAYLTKVYIQKPESVTYLGTESQDGVTCQWLKDNSTIIVCDQIGNPLRKDRTVYFVLRLNVPHKLTEKADVYNITAWVNTSSVEETPQNDYKVMKFRVINKAELSLTTNVVPDNTILCKGEPRNEFTNETDIGASVKHNFIVRNAGPGVVLESYIKIKWPYAVAVQNEGGKPEKYLLYLMRKPNITSGTGVSVRCNDAEIEQYINPQKIKEVIDINPSRDAELSVEPTLSGDVQKRRKRELDSRTKREIDARAKRATTTLVFSCQDHSAKCFEYRCTLSKLEMNTDFVKITMEARLWENTLLTDYRKIAEVQIESWGEISIPARLRITQDTSDDKKRAITRAVPDYKETSAQAVQWWIILVAVLVGLVVLLVLIFVLYKLGFFRRKRMEDMQMYKAEKKQQPMLQDEYEDDGA